MNNRLSEEEKDEIIARAKQSHKHNIGGGLLPKCPNCQGTGIDPTIPNYNKTLNSKPEQLATEARGTVAEALAFFCRESRPWSHCSYQCDECAEIERGGSAKGQP